MKSDDAKAGVRAIFRKQGVDVYDLSPCCRATEFKGVCMNCGKAIQMPYYFVTRHQDIDETILDVERSVRAKMPAGYTLLSIIP